MSNQETYETIEAYLNGTLSGARLADFEARLQSDKDLAAQVSLFKDIDVAVGNKPVLNFQKLVQEEGKAFMQKSASKGAIIRRIGWPRRYLAIASALLVLVLSIVVLWNIQSGTPPSGKELFAQNFETYTLNQNLRSDDTAVNTEFSSGIQQYQAKDFAAAAATFQKLAVNDDQNMILAFCLANAYLNQQPPQLASAAQQFQKIIEEGESIYVLRAKWYRALIHLENGELEEAENLLKEVAKSRDNFGEKATALLKELAD